LTTDKVEQFGRKLQKTGEGISRAGGRLTKTVTLSIVTIGLIGLMTDCGSKLNALDE
jgi:hypothetical protein